MEYTQSNLKKTVAKKMGLTMHGGPAKGSLSMKPKLNGGKTMHKGGMKPKMHGEDEGFAHGEKPTQSNKKHSFSSTYTQHGGKKN